MKKKFSGIQIAWLNSGGYKKVDLVHYDRVNIAYPVTNDMSIKILILEIMAAWTSKIHDVRVVLLHGEVTDNEEPIYMDIPQVFDKYCEEDY